jgi:hypothetical protein
MLMRIRNVNGTTFCFARFPEQNSGAAENGVASFWPSLQAKLM